MNLTYFDIDKTSHLIEDFYHISYSKKLTPFKTVMIPLGINGFTFIYGNGQKAIINKKETDLKNLILNGQFYKSYNFIVNEVGFSCGMNFKPTALHKLTGLNISKFTNKHSSFNKIDTNLSSQFELIFKNHNNDFKSLFEKIENLLIKIPLIKNKNVNVIDNIINYIHEKEGLLFVSELLEKIPFGQKTLETQFKKIVGLTPAKYIRIHRFTNLMKQYESKKIELKDLIYMYNYYDESHFSKDFKLFTSRLPKEYFNEDFILIKQALKK